MFSLVIARARRKPRSMGLFLSGLLIGSTVGLAAAAGPAAIPSAAGVFSACYDAGGNVKLIDPAVTPTCPKGFIGPVTWNAVGQRGAQGPQGLVGPAGPTGSPGATGSKGADGAPGGVGPRGAQGETGAAGKDGKDGEDGTNGRDGTGSIASLDELNGLACSTHVGRAGTILVATGSDDAVAITCVTTPTWCELNTPTVGAHMTVACDEGAESLSFTCDELWVDVDGSHQNGCETSYGDAIIGPGELFVSGQGIAVAADCIAGVGCRGGVPVSPLATVDLSWTSPTVEQIGARSFSVTAGARINSVGSIPITMEEGDCLLTIRSSGLDPTALAVFNVDFRPDVNTAGGYQIFVSGPTVFDIASEDLVVFGSNACEHTAIPTVQIATIVLETGVRHFPGSLPAPLCVAPPPDLIEMC